MGSVASVRRRYMGGKSISAYFLEDCWPDLEEVLDRLNITESRSLEIFKAFAHADVNEDELLDITECFNYLSEIRTKFTERIFHGEATTDSNGSLKMGLTFKQFLITTWNYCTLSNFGLARLIFEIFDVDSVGTLEKPDIDTMYKMLYSTDEVDTEYISVYTYDQNGKIAKNNFCDISAKQRYLIYPAIDFQSKIRRKVGGRTMWLALSSYRQRILEPFVLNNKNNKDAASNHNTNINTIAEDVEEIISTAKQFSTRRAKLSAEQQLKDSRDKIDRDNEMAKQELKLRERLIESETRMLNSTAPDRKMHQAWSIFQMRKTQFVDEEYLDNQVDIQRRYEDRMELFALFDAAKKESLIYWEYRDNKEISIVEGTEADHEARYQDYLKTAEGKAMLQIMQLIHTLRVILSNLAAKAMKKKKDSGSNSAKSIDSEGSGGGSSDSPTNRRRSSLWGNGRAKTDKEKYLSSQLQELEQVVELLQDPTINSTDHAKHLKHLYERDFTEERALVRKNASRADIQLGNANAHAEECARLRTKTVNDMMQSVAADQEQRRREYALKEFELITHYGSRTTRWEYVLCRQDMKYYYVARDGVELSNSNQQRMHHRTAICENCDNILIQHEMRCDNCSTVRSAKNQKLYRPLGCRDITLD